jgi:hypothetical protein
VAGLVAVVANTAATATTAGRRLRAFAGKVTRLVAVAASHSFENLTSAATTTTHTQAFYRDAKPSRNASSTNSRIFVTKQPIVCENMPRGA